MRKKILAFICLATALLVCTPGWGQQVPAMKSVTVDLPPGDSLFPGDASADAINNNCLACHSADMVLNQAAEAEVHKMINAYKAPIDETDVPSIVDCLADKKGEKSSRSKPYGAERQLTGPDLVSREPSSAPCLHDEVPVRGHELRNLLLASAWNCIAMAVPYYHRR